MPGRGCCRRHGVIRELIALHVHVGGAAIDAALQSGPVQHLCVSGCGAACMARGGRHLATKIHQFALEEMRQEGYELLYGDLSGEAWRVFCRVGFLYVDSYVSMHSARSSSPRGSYVLLWIKATGNTCAASLPTLWLPITIKA
jgi:hypothetical protein